ncbi:LytTR family DNA-binding domain-containing protein [Ruminococcaceae bacterium OttesenSCG-928-A11]|nr:LytTR family DNA-binding domain-containing protein [Ruminococcaceae bacterium OttesenSCG-928-A11]
MYRVAICDDEPAILEATRELCGHALDELEADYELTSFCGPQPLLDALHQGAFNFHVLVLDIDLGGEENGIAVARTLRQAGVGCGIIFATAFADYALDGYSVQPIQYLLKPLDPAALREALRLNYNSVYRKRHLIITPRDGTQAIPIADIHYIEIMGRTATFHTGQGTLNCPARLKDLELELMDDNFVRCHKSFLVNLGKVQRVKRYEFQLKTGETVPISKSYYTAAQTAFIRYHNR